MFCPKCGAILLPKKVDNKNAMACSSCGFTDKNPGTKLTEKSGKESGKISIIEKDVESEVLPKIDAECPKCKHTKAYYWTVQTRAGDEAETKFLKCVKCNHTWRDYD